MKSPSTMTRFIGTQPVPALLCAGVGLIILAWISGAVPWWVGIMALFFGGTVVNDAQKVKAYDAWFAQWQAMGGVSASLRAEKKPPSRGRLTLQAGVLGFVAWVVWNMVPAGQKPSQGESVVWCVMVFGCVWSTCRLLAAFRREGAGSVAVTKKTATETKSTNEVVEWSLPPASSSPSRLNAVRNLPEYAASLLKERA